MVFFSVSALILYTLLYRAKLVPAWLSIWGLIGGALLLVRAVLEMYGVEFSAVMQGALATPIGINEMVLAVWHIVKGFNAAPSFVSSPGLGLPAEQIPHRERCQMRSVHFALCSVRTLSRSTLKVSNPPCVGNEGDSVSL